MFLTWSICFASSRGQYIKLKKLTLGEQSVYKFSYTNNASTKITTFWDTSSYFHLQRRGRWLPRNLWKICTRHHTHKNQFAEDSAFNWWRRSLKRWKLPTRLNGFIRHNTTMCTFITVVTSNTHQFMIL